MDGVGGVSDLRAFAHPVRLQMLVLLADASMCAADLARELGLTHANASYHLRRLAAAHQVVAAGEERIRGGLAKLYRCPRHGEIVPSADARPTRTRGELRLMREASVVAYEAHRRPFAPDTIQVRFTDWSHPEQAGA